MKECPHCKMNLEAITSQAAVMMSNLEGEMAESLEVLIARNQELQQENEDLRQRLAEVAQ